MSISEREQQTLASIADGLARSAPKLAAMLAIFTRLTADEKMPVRRPVRRAARVMRTTAGPAAPPPGPGRAGRRGHGRGARQWVWLAVAVALLALFVTMSRGTGARTCPALRAAACEQVPAPAHPAPRRPRGL